MQAFYVNGPSQGAKSTIGNVVAAHGRKRGLVVVDADAGKHYRRLTKGTRRELGLADEDIKTLPDERRVARALAEVLRTQQAYDNEIDWGDLHAPGVNAWVSTKIANRPEVKDDAQQWYERTAQKALDTGADVLGINGRQPRWILQPWQDRTGVGTAAEIWAECDPSIAAARLVSGRGRRAAQARVAQRDLIITRRTADMLHTRYPMIPPADAVFYSPNGFDPDELQWAADAAVEASFGLDSGDLPRQIIFDNSLMPLGAMTMAVECILDASLERTADVDRRVLV